jgi:hypothetical protein
MTALYEFSLSLSLCVERERERGRGSGRESKLKFISLKYQHQTTEFEQTGKSAWQQPLNLVQKIRFDLGFYILFLF